MFNEERVSGLLSSLILIIVGFAATLALNGCVVGGANPYAYPPYAQRGYPQQGLPRGGGPVGRVANRLVGGPTTRVLAPEAGRNEYAGTRYDSAEHLAIMRYETARRGTTLPMGGDGPAVAGSPPADTRHARAASAEQVQHLSVTVSQMARTQREHGEILRSQGVALGQLARERHPHRHRRADPPPAVPTAEAAAPPAQPSADAPPMLAGTVVYPDDP